MEGTKMLWEIARTGMDPFTEMRRVQREMNRLFENAGTTREEFPPVNIWGNEDELIVTAELPGIDPNDMHIHVTGDQLTLEGERKADEMGEDVTYHRRERANGKFVRAFRLPYEVDNEKVKANYKNGILKITLPRTEVTKPKKITIETK